MPNILVIDDSQSARDCLCRLLQSAGYRTILADNVWQGLGVVETTQVDLVVLDLDLPVMGGQDFLDDLQGDKRFRRLAVVAMSGLKSRPEMWAMYPNNLRAWLRKAEFDGEELLEVIRKNLPAESRRVAVRDHGRAVVSGAA